MTFSLKMISSFSIKSHVILFFYFFCFFFFLGEQEEEERKKPNESNSRICVTTCRI